MSTQVSVQSLLVAPNEGTSLHVMQDTLRVLARPENTNGQYEVFDLTGCLNSGPPPHHHPWSESYFILEGEVEIRVGDHTVTATPGYFVTVPPEGVHTYRINSQMARFLVITSGDAASGFFKDMDQLEGQDRANIEKITAVATRHQVIPVAGCD